jgi:lysophospholipid acyltransferase (LPLAT)-like uncharacterized protein
MMSGMARAGKVREFFLSTLGKGLYRLWMMSARVTVVGEHHYRKLREEGKPVVIAVWHGRILFTTYFLRHRGIMPLVSPSGDGEIVIRLASGLGYKFMRGSGSHSMLKAWGGLRQELLSGGQVIIVPDGPKGPGQVMKAGALKLSQATGAAILPFSYSTTRKKFLSSWDRFLLFFPFHRVVAVYGEPLSVTPKLSEEEFEQQRQRLERRLQDLDAWADHYFERDS